MEPDAALLISATEAVARAGAEWCLSMTEFCLAECFASACECKDIASAVLALVPPT